MIDAEPLVLRTGVRLTKSAEAASSRAQCIVYAGTCSSGAKFMWFVGCCTDTVSASDLIMQGGTRREKSHLVSNSRISLSLSPSPPPPPPTFKRVGGWGWGMRACGQVISVTINKKIFTDDFRLTEEVLECSTENRTKKFL